MSKLFKILILLIVVTCFSCTALFACGKSSESESEPKESVSESESGSEEETESNFEVELPKVDRN